MTTKLLTLEDYRQKLATDPNWAERAILALYDRQTIAEQAMGETTQRNSVGFNGADAFILSSFAKQLRRAGYHLSAKQLAIARKKLPKYAKQLMDIAEEKKPQPQPVTTSVPDPDPTVLDDEWEDRLHWKAQFAEKEAAEEQLGFLSDPDFQPSMSELDAMVLRLMRS